jgi:hypothetical protein
MSIEEKGIAPAEPELWDELSEEAKAELSNGKGDESDE